MAAVLYQVPTYPAVANVGKGADRVTFAVQRDGTLTLTDPRGKPVDRERFEAEAAYATLADERWRPYEVYQKYRALAEGKSQYWDGTGLPQSLHHAALDQRVNLALTGNRPLVAYERMKTTGHIRRRLMQSINACRYPNVEVDRARRGYLHPSLGYHNDQLNGDCKVSRSFVKPLAELRTLPHQVRGYGSESAPTALFPILFVHVDYAWFTEVYMRGIAVVDSHLVLSIRDEDSDGLIFVRAVVANTSDYNKVWQRNAIVYKSHLHWEP